MKRANIILALVFVSLFGLSSCGDDEVNEMVKDPTTEKMQPSEHVHEDDLWD